MAIMYLHQVWMPIDDLFKNNLVTTLPLSPCMGSFHTIDTGSSVYSHRTILFNPHAAKRPALAPVVTTTSTTSGDTSEWESHSALYHTVVQATLS